jgi:hypothetical protein
VKVHLKDERKSRGPTGPPKITAREIGSWAGKWVLAYLDALKLFASFRVTAGGRANRPALQKYVLSLSETCLHLLRLKTIARLHSRGLPPDLSWTHGTAPKERA